MNPQKEAYSLFWSHFFRFAQEIQANQTSDISDSGHKFESVTICDRQTCHKQTCQMSVATALLKKAREGTLFMRDSLHARITERWRSTLDWPLACMESQSCHARRHTPQKRTASHLIITVLWLYGRKLSLIVTNTSKNRDAVEFEYSTFI
mmetsp:Transcript_65620/g.96106  ORF Transcript_65620/g.96106 Transcript_65620/m.96106 type:complete len:150 (-) Transcript_65620:166-615(-)